VFDTRQTSLCRVSFCAECPALGKESRCRESSFTECGTRQILLCRVPDKRHSAKIATLGKALDSGSVGSSSHFAASLRLGAWAPCHKRVVVHQHPRVPRLHVQQPNGAGDEGGGDTPVHLKLQQRWRTRSDGLFACLSVCL
jgi:hypothetical protein